MKKGFTLVELLCSIIIIAVIIILAIPNITNIVGGEKNNISDTMKNTIISAGELYVQDNIELYPKVKDNVYCVSINKLIEEKRLSTPLKDPVTKNNIDTNKYVKVSVNNNYEYELTDSCDEVISYNVAKLYGDVNNDNVVNHQDRIYLARYLDNQEGYTLTNIMYKNADVNVDGTVDNTDYTILQRHLAGWEGYETLPYNN